MIWLMKPIASISLALVLGGCGTIYEKIGDVYDSVLEGDKRRAVQQAADDTKCRELGFKHETEAYGNCRLQLQQIRAIRQSGR